MTKFITKFARRYAFPFFESYWHFYGIAFGLAVVAAQKDSPMQAFGRITGVIIALTIILVLAIWQKSFMSDTK